MNTYRYTFVTGKVQHTEPCSDCPGRRDSLKGWLGGARTKEQAESVSACLFNPLPQDEVISQMQSFYLHKEQADEVIDAAIAANTD